MTIRHKPKTAFKFPESTWEKNRILSELGVDGNTPIYKYYPLKYLISSLQNKQLLINQVNKWDDVYENFLFKQPLTLSNGTPIDWLSYTECIYGQCWSLLKSSDAMWRIYSRLPQNINDIEDVAIRVQTTVAKLWDAIFVDDFSMINSRIGIVKYLNDQDIYDWLQAHTQIKANPDLAAIMFDSLQIKREPFAHEEELRILVMEERDKDPNKSSFPDFLSYDIDPAQFFDEFVIEPRLKAPVIVGEIQHRLKTLAPTINVRQSRLYTMQHKVQMTIH